MATVYIGSARIDERGRASGGQAGDQTGKEVSTQAWYRHAKGWAVLRPKDGAKAKKIAEAMQVACDNDNIGYDQYQNQSLWNLVKDKGFDPAKADKPCETDCARLVRVCCAYAGIMADDFYTATEATVLMRTGEFIKLTDSKYTDAPDYLGAGDILVTRSKGHTAVVLSNGKYYDGSADEPEDEPAGPSVEIRGGNAYIRTGPGTQYDTMGVAHAGDVFEDANPDGWNAILYGGRIGWVSGKYSARKE